MALEATTLIDFGGSQEVDSTTAHVIFEFDDVLNEDKTSFSPGDEIYMRVQLSGNVSLLGIVATDGSVKSYGSANRDAEEIVDFVSRTEGSETEHALQYNPYGGISVEYLGRDGSLTYKQSANGETVAVGNAGYAPFKAKINYGYRCSIYKLITPNVTLVGDESYPISIVLYLKETGTTTGGSTDECNRS